MSAGGRGDWQSVIWQSAATLWDCARLKSATVSGRAWLRRCSSLNAPEWRRGTALDAEPRSRRETSTRMPAAF